MPYKKTAKRKKRSRPKSYKRALKDYVERVVGELTSISYCVRYISTKWLNEETNSDNGYFSIRYTPANYDAELYIYKGVFASIPDGGITKGFKHFIKRCLCHEFGHAVIWELEASKKTIEKKATEVGLLLHSILDNRGL